MSRTLAVVASAISILALWIYPPVGFVLCVAISVWLPTWGRSLAERASITLVGMAGVTAIVFSRLSPMPISELAARLALSLMVAALLSIRLVHTGPMRLSPMRSPSDVVCFAVGVVSACAVGWQYLGRTSSQVLGGLFLTGWDNQAHFTTYANSYATQSGIWTTADGSTAWNQWYPSLHTTAWSLAQKASEVSTIGDRAGLLGSYVLWSALTFGVCLLALSWVASDAVHRLAPARAALWAAPAAALATGILLGLGSTAWLFNFGFTNYLLALTVLVLTAYLSARSRSSARVLGPWLIPLGALALAGLWTPLVLGLVPSGLVVLVVLWRWSRARAITWLVLSALVVGGSVIAQSRAIVNADPGQATSDFATNLGGITSGFIDFPTIAAIVLPAIIVIVAVIVLARIRQWFLPVALGGTFVALLPFLALTVRAAVSAKVSPLDSYYVLKVLDGMLVIAIPLVIALAIALVTRVLPTERSSRVIPGVTIAAIVILAVLIPAVEGMPAADAARARTAAAADALTGEVILASRDALDAQPSRTAFMWDGGGTLQNYWLRSLSGVLSTDEYRFYGSFPESPYDSSAQAVLATQLDAHPKLRVTVGWFREPTRILVDELQRARGEYFVTGVRVPMAKSPLCPECAP